MCTYMCICICIRIYLYAFVCIHVNLLIHRCRHMNTLFNHLSTQKGKDQRLGITSMYIYIIVCVYLHTYVDNGLG